MTNLNLKIKDQQPANEENLGSFYMGRMKPSTPTRRVLPRGALTFTTLFAFAAIIWYAYPRGQERYSDIDIPVIAADKAVYKFKPDDPGGMEVLHQDSTVFDPLEKKPADTVAKVRPKPEEPMVKPESAKVAPTIDQTPHNLVLQEVSHGSEKIIAAPEEKPAPVVKKEEPKKEEAKKDDVKATPMPPMPKPGEAAKAEQPKPHAVKTETAKAEPVKSAPAKLETAKHETIKPLPAKTETVKVTDGEPSKGAAVPDIGTVNSEPLPAPVLETPKVATKPAIATAKVETKPAAKAATKPEAKTTSKTAPTAAGVFIQLGAYHDDKGAHEQWTLLGKKFPSELKGLSIHTEPAPSPKGTLTRLQAGRVTEERARKICDELKAGNAACIIVRQ